MTASPDRAIHGTPTPHDDTLSGESSSTANELGFSIACRIAIEPSVLMVQPQL